MIHLLLAAALSKPAAKPLFVPPKGMIRVKNNPNDEKAYSRDGIGTIIATYRGTLHEKPSWSPITYSVPLSIIIVKYPTVVNPDVAARMAIAEMTPTLAAQRDLRANFLASCERKHLKCRAGQPTTQIRPNVLSDKPVSPCNGNPRWYLSYVAWQSGTVTDEILVRSGNWMYAAQTHYTALTGDAFHAKSALMTLCPPPQPKVQIARVREEPLPFSPPRWTRGDVSTLGAPESYVAKGVWWPQLGSDNRLFFYEASDTDEYVTPEQDNDEVNKEVAGPGFRLLHSAAHQLCQGRDGWFTTFTHVGLDGRTYITEMMYGYGGDTSYLVQYVRLADAPEDPAARKALFSLCPPGEAPAPMQTPTPAVITPTPSPVSSATPR